MKCILSHVTFFHQNSPESFAFQVLFIEKEQKNLNPVCGHILRFIFM
jgi:hypothetical protein